MNTVPLAVNEASANYLPGGTPPGYKRTEVGLIPEEWDVAPLAKLSAFITKGATPTTYGFKWEQGGVLFLRSECVSDEGLDLGQSMYISAAAHEALRRSAVCDGDILITITGNVGRVVLLKGVGAANINQHIARIRITAPGVMPGYVHHFLSQPGVRRTFNSITTGQAYPQISLQQVRAAKVALPPEPEQRAIAEALSDVDGLLAALETLTAKKRAIKQAAMQQLLTGKTRLPGFSGEWEKKRLGAILKFQVGCPFSSRYFTSTGLGLRLVRNRDLKADDDIVHYNGPYTDDYLITNGGVLVGMDGDFLPCMWNKGEALLNQRVGRLRVSSDLDARFAYYFLLKPLKEIERATSSTTVKHLSHGDVEGIIGLIPQVSEQTAIATVLSDLDAEIAALEQRRDKTRAIKQGMMQQLLTGRVRLVKPE